MMGTLKPTVHQTWNILTFNIKYLPSVPPVLLLNSEKTNILTMQ